jgi:hypothetical protein
VPAVELFIDNAGKPMTLATLKNIVLDDSSTFISLPLTVLIVSRYQVRTAIN